MLFLLPAAAISSFALICMGLENANANASTSIRLISILNVNLIDFCKWQSCTPGSNLTYLAPQDNFSLVPNYFLGPPEHEKNVPKYKLIWAL